MVKCSLTLILGIVLYAALPQGALALVNVNSATKDQLMEVEGLGETTANRIIEYRNTSGAITNLATLCGFRNIKNIETDTCKTLGAGIYFGPLESNSDSEASETTTTTTSSGSTVIKVTKSASPGPITGLTLTVPDKAYAGQHLSFDVNPDDGKGRTARYSWNFGDGTTDDYKRPTHRYTHPGTYVVMVESYYQKETKLARKEIEILPLAIKLETLSAKEIRVTNNGSYEIDLGSMQLLGKNTFTFPKYTILLPDQSLVAKVDNAGSVALKDGEGVVLANGAAEVLSPPRQLTTPATKRIVTKVSTPVATSTEEVSVEGEDGESVALVAKNQTASLPAADVPVEAWPYLALFAVMGLGIFALYGTRG